MNNREHVIEVKVATEGGIGGSSHLSKIIPELWQLFTENEREQLLIWSSFTIYKSGEVIYEPNQPHDYAYVLASGQVKITQGADKSQIIRIVAPSEFFGYYSHFTNHPTTPSAATALEESLIFKIPLTSLELVLRSNSAVALFFVQDLARILQEHAEMMIAITQKHSRGRLATALLMLHNKFGIEKDGTTIKAYLSRNELAELSNMTASNVVRTLKAFQDEHLIQLDGRRIKLLNKEKLKRIKNIG